MVLNKVQPHFLPRNRYGEKGVDMELGLEMYSSAVSGRIDIAALLATDGDFAPLARRVRSVGVEVVLLGFHLPHIQPKPIALSPRLADSVSLLVPMPELIDRPTPTGRLLVDGIFLQRDSRWAPNMKCA
jgi:hypothetical protein